MTIPVTTSTELESVLSELASHTDDHDWGVNTDCEFCNWVNNLDDFVKYTMCTNNELFYLYVGIRLGRLQMTVDLSKLADE